MVYPLWYLQRFQRGERLRRNRLCGAPKIGYGILDRCVCRAKQISLREVPQRRALRKRAAGLQAVGKIDGAIEARHASVRDGVLGDGRKHLRVVDPKALAGQRRSERGVQNDRIFPRKCVDRNRPALAFFNQSLRRKEAREIVQQAGDSCLLRIQAMPLRQQIGRAGDANHVRVTMILPELRANVARERGVPQRGSSETRSAASRAR